MSLKQKILAFFAEAKEEELEADIKAMKDEEVKPAEEVKSMLSDEEKIELEALRARLAELEAKAAESEKEETEEMAARAEVLAALTDGKMSLSCAKESILCKGSVAIRAALKTAVPVASAQPVTKNPESDNKLATYLALQGKERAAYLATHKSEIVALSNKTKGL